MTSTELTLSKEMHNINNGREGNGWPFLMLTIFLINLLANIGKTVAENSLSLTYSLSRQVLWHTKDETYFV